MTSNDEDNEAVSLEAAIR